MKFLYFLLMYPFVILGVTGASAILNTTIIENEFLRYVVVGALLVNSSIVFVASFTLPAILVARRRKSPKVDA